MRINALQLTPPSLAMPAVIAFWRQPWAFSQTGQRLAAALQALPGEAPELVVEQRQELLGIFDCEDVGLILGRSSRPGMRTR